MFANIRKWTSKHREFFVLASPVTIMLIYLCCSCFYVLGIDDIKEIFEGLPFYIPPAFVNSLTIFLIYWAWQSYRKENVPAVITILLAGIAMILPFSEGAFRPENWPDYGEKLFGFALILWPVLITCLSDFCMRKLFRNDKIVFGINTAVVFVLAAGFHLIVEGMMEEKWSNDLGVPAIWLAESIIWSAALYFTDRDKGRKRNMVMAWLACLGIFYCFTFMRTSYLGSGHIWDMVRARYWNRILFLCWPVFLTAMIRVLCARIPKDDPYFVQKVSILYFSIVLILSYLLTDISLNFATGAFRDDLCDMAYLLFLAEFVVWKEVYGQSEHKESRVRALLFLLLLNIGVFVFLLVRNDRLQEVLYYMGFSFMGRSIADPQADWTGYRKAAVQAFFSNDLTVLDHIYKNEGYYNVVYDSHGLAAIRFLFGMLPVLAMILLLVIAVIALWNWNRGNEVLHKCARYLAVGYLLKMLMSVVLQMNMVLAPYSEFPFTGFDMPELVVLILLICEGHRKFREAEGGLYGF